MVVLKGDVLAEVEWDKVIQNMSGDNGTRNKGEIVENAKKSDKNKESPSFIPPVTQDEPAIANLSPQALKRTRVSDTSPESELNTSREFSIKTQAQHIFYNEQWLRPTRSEYHMHCGVS